MLYIDNILLLSSSQSSDVQEIISRQRLPTAQVQITNYGWGDGTSILNSSDNGTVADWVLGTSAKYRLNLSYGDATPAGSYKQAAHIIGYLEDDAIPDYNGLKNWKEIAASADVLDYVSTNTLIGNFVPVPDRAELAYSKYAIIDSARGMGVNNLPITFAASLDNPVPLERYVIKGTVTSIDDLTNPELQINPEEEVLVTRDGLTLFTVVTNYASIATGNFDWTTESNKYYPGVLFSQAGVTTSPLPPNYFIYPVTLSTTRAQEQAPDGVINTIDALVADTRIKIRTLY